MALSLVGHGGAVLWSCRVQHVCRRLGMSRPKLDIDLNPGYTCPGGLASGRESIWWWLRADEICRLGVDIPTGESLPSGPYNTGPRD
jgi:hypothetical protein